MKKENEAGGLAWDHESVYCRREDCMTDPAAYPLCATELQIRENQAELNRVMTGAPPNAVCEMIKKLQRDGVVDTASFSYESQMKVGQLDSVIDRKKRDLHTVKHKYLFGGKLIKALREADMLPNGDVQEVTIVVENNEFASLEIRMPISEEQLSLLGLTVIGKGD